MRTVTYGVTGLKPLPLLVRWKRWLVGCSHRRLTFPMKRDDTTYVVCLECGREFVYDWDRMEVKRKLLT